MRIGVTGHQERKGIDWSWVSKALLQSFAGKVDLVGLTSLAEGADQVFAECILNKGGSIIAIIPTHNYRDHFQSSSAIAKYEMLLEAAEVVDLGSNKESKQAFLDAGKWIARNSDILYAIWDGEDAAGKGGTADIVRYAVTLGKRVVRIDPIRREIK